MKKTFKRIAAVLAAASVIGTASIGASAATKDDVIAAARGAGFLEEYVQQLINFLNTSKYTESQYDIMADSLYGAGEEMNEIALRYFGKTIPEMKGQGGSSDNSKDKEDDKSDAQQWVEEQIKDAMTEKDIMNVLDHIVEGGKEIGLDITVENKGDKNFIMTVKDKDGNIQFVTPIGKLVDRTGVEEVKSNSMPIAMGGCAVLTAVGIAGAVTIAVKMRKNEE